VSSPTSTPLGFRRDVLPLHLEPLQDDAAKSLQTAFVQRWPHPFLVYTRSKLWDKALLLSAPGRDVGETQVVRYELYEGGLSFLHPIRKLQTDQRHPGIVLGRANVQDMVVPVASISNAHAAFIPPQPGNATWTVMDLGSRNGTWLNEDQLSQREPRPIKDNEYLRLGGNLLAWFLSPGRLWSALRNPAELRRYTEV
jgi:hypothetical protein